MRGLVRLGGLGRDEVSIEVLKEGRSGLLGFGSEEARVRLTPLSGARTGTEDKAAAADDKRGADEAEARHGAKAADGAERQRGRQRGRGSEPKDDAPSSRDRGGRGQSDSQVESARRTDGSPEPASGTAGADQESDGATAGRPRRSRRGRKAATPRPSAAVVGTEAVTGKTADKQSSDDSTPKAPTGEVVREHVGAGSERSGYGRRGAARGRGGRQGVSRGLREQSEPGEPAPDTPLPEIPDGTPSEVATAVLRAVLDRLGYPDARIEPGEMLLPADDEDDGPGDEDVLCVRGGGVRSLVGAEGETMDALQFVTRLLVGRHVGEWSKVLVDVEDARRNRITELSALAEQSAQLVEKDGRPVSLPPMNAYERRVVHLVLRGHPSIGTQSIGQGDTRKVTVRRRDQMLPEF